MLAILRIVKFYLESLREIRLLVFIVVSLEELHKNNSTREDPKKKLLSFEVFGTMKFGLMFDIIPSVPWDFLSVKKRLFLEASFSLPR